MLFAIGCTVEVCEMLLGTPIFSSTIFSVTSVLAISIGCSTRVAGVDVFVVGLTVATEVFVCWFWLSDSLAEAVALSNSFFGAFKSLSIGTLKGEGVVD